jgi:hypothetical protein
VYERRVLVVLVLGVVVWAFTASWLWHRLEVQAKEAVAREAAIAHEGRVQQCRALNELTKEIQLALLDAGEPVLAARFEETRDCETIP